MSLGVSEGHRSAPVPADATIVSRLLTQASEQPLVHNGAGWLTVGALRAASAGLAARLQQEHAVAHGDRVALLVEPGANFVVALVGLWRAGAAALVLTPLHPAAERERLMHDAGVALLIDDARLAALLEPATAPSAASVAPDGGAAIERPVPDDLALLVYTSGTTSRPKGVMLQHRQLVAQCSAIAAAWRLGPDDRLVHALPLHHVHGLVISLLSTLWGGGRATLLPRFEPAAVLAACASGTVFMGVPTMYARLLDAIDALPANARAATVDDLRALRLCVSGSAGLPVSLGQRWAELTGSYPLERFGMTEVGVALSNRVDGERLPGSVGWPLTGVRVRVVDEAGAVSDEGELQLAGPTVFAGYWRNAAADREAFVESDGARWFRSGDTVRRGEDGSVRILGRSSVDILKSAGYKLSALAIEEVIRRHPDVRDAAVVGLPDETYGQVVAAAVMPRAGARLTRTALDAFLRSELASYQRPRRLRVVEDVPRNALGKVVKPALIAAWPERDD